MGPPVSPVLVKISIEWHEGAMHKPAPVIQTVWWRYVDDRLVLIDKTFIPQFYAYINNQEQSIILTKEEEVEQQLPFLDMKGVSKTDSFLGFDSHHP